ncbi:MAG: KamA family radical SAM protein [Candidatus Omnitrophota bacterium]
MRQNQVLLDRPQVENAPTSAPCRRKTSFPVDYSDLSIFKDVSPLEWEDWHWQLKNSIRSKEQLSQVIPLTPEEEEGIRRSRGRLSLSISPYWLTLINPQDNHCPIRRQAVPQKAELDTVSHEMIDPCAEDRDSPVPGLVHRYPDRVLLLVTEHCAMYCRHCTRRRIVGDRDSGQLNLDAAVDYIKSNRKIRDVLISGGDPLMLEDDVLEEIIIKLRSASNVEFLRIGTRMPVTLPQRITERLTRMLNKHGPIWISLQFNHYREITKRVKQAVGMLADYGIPLGSQTVLLKGVNDRPYIMRKLMHELLKIRVRPYYIYQCDPVKGTAHFRTPVAVGINIIEKMRGYTSGYAVPTYVVDAPGGGGKIPVSPNYILSQDKGRYTLRNYKGKIYTYIE